MKKIILFNLLFIFFCVGIIAKAEEVKYGNLITDETTIEEDFKLLNIDINEYYKPTKYNYQKWYVIGMSEGYVDTEDYEIQTYFYLYNPVEYGASNNYMSTVASIYLSYNLKESVQGANNYSCQKLDYNKEHLIYKVKGFTYDFKEREEIYITSIKHYNFYGSGITSDSGFKAVANHSKLNGFQVELSFNSTLIIEDIAVAGIEITPKNSIFNYLFSGKFFEDLFKKGVNSKTLQLFFYNFNFPKRIKPDSIEKAVFQYQKESWKKKYRLKGFNWTYHSEEQTNTESKNPSLFPKDFTFDVGDQREELNFPRFYLGNRIKDKQFGDLIFKEEDSNLFDRDCSIFLDYDYEVVYERMEVNIFGNQPDTKYIEYSKLSDVELLELWYQQDGILYKCQVVSQPEDSKPIQPEDPASSWEKFCKWFIEKFPWSLLIFAAPVLVIVVAIFFPHIFSLIFNFLIVVFNYIISALQWLLKTILKIITFPIWIIIRIFKRE